jgi:hypothetical protein
MFIESMGGMPAAVPAGSVGDATPASAAYVAYQLCVCGGGVSSSASPPIATENPTRQRHSAHDAQRGGAAPAVAAVTDNAVRTRRHA